MHESACTQDDIIAAFDELKQRLDARRGLLWQRYLEITREEPFTRYREAEAESWSVLQAALTGLEAEHRMAERSFEKTLGSFDNDENRPAARAS